MHLVVRTLCFLLIACATVFAQSDKGTITGTVSDPVGAVVPAAAIVAKNAQTGTEYQTETTATGNYTLAQLPAGVYQLTVSVSGFKQFTRQGITVNVAQTHRIDIALEVGSLSESVTVSADAPLLKTESGELSHNVTAEKLNELPLLGTGATAAGSSGIRNPYAVTQLAPGTLWLPNNSVRLNGTPANSQSLRIEGQDATNGFANWASAQVQPSVDAISEFAIQTSNFAAEFGQAGGGVFNVTMRSGTNQLHGSVYDYFVNEALNAGTPFTQDPVKGTLIRPVARRHNYGFTVGGPVFLPRIYDGHDKTFFFFNFEQFRETQFINNQFITVPTDAYRNGDFSALLRPNSIIGKDPIGRDIIEGAIYDPATTKVAPNGQVYRDPFPNNQIDPSRFDPVAVKIQNMIPRATVPGAALRNGVYPYPSKRVTTIPAFKVDHSLNSAQKLSFYWSATRTASQFSPTLGLSEGLPAPITAARGTFINSYTMRLNYDYTVRPTVLLHIGVGFMHNTFNDNAPTLDFDPVRDLGIPGPTTPRNFPTFLNLSTTQGGGMGNMGPNGLGDNGQTEALMEKPTFNASAVWVRNDHTYKIGLEGYTAGYPNINRGKTDGLYRFSANQTALPYLNTANPGGRPIGFPYASFLLGLTDSADVAAVSNPRLGKKQLALFVQDTWKVTRKLTLDYGLRWDYGTYQREQYGRHPSFSPTTLNPSVGLLGGVIFEGFGPGRCNCDFASNYMYALGPRLGVAYQISPKTVLRAGWGISYGSTPDNNQGTQQISSGNPIFPAAFGEAAMKLSQGLPHTAEQIAWPKYDAGLYPLKGTPSIAAFPTGLIDPNAGRPPRIFQWSIGLQREITQNLAVEVSYVGNRGAWWQANSLVDYNALTEDRLASHGLSLNNAADRTLLLSQVSSQLARDRGFGTLPYASFPANATVAQSLRPYPHFLGIPAVWAPLGRTWYDSLQAKATKRFSHGLDFTYTFTWQKELTMGIEGDPPGFGAPTASFTDVFRRDLNKFISGYSRPFVTVLAANYTVPGLSGNRWLSLAMRDWKVGAMLQYSSGQPIRAPFAQSTGTSADQAALNSYLLRNLPAGPGGFPNTTYANRVPGEPLFLVDTNCHCYDPNTTFLLNPKAWSNPAPGQWGTSAAYYNDYRYQRRPNESMSLGRLFRFSEAASFEIRAEFSNIFNRAVLPNPDAASIGNAQAAQIKNNAGQAVSGFGFINTRAAGSPRQGTIVARIRF
jgi:hypothetical protein